MDSCLCLRPDRTWHKVNDPKVDYSGAWRKGRSGSNRGSNLAELCKSSTHLVQCKTDEPCRTWTQTWIQAGMPNNSLNWTKWSSDIQCCQWHYRQPEGGSAEARSHLASNLSLTLDTAPSQPEIIISTSIDHMVKINWNPNWFPVFPLKTIAKKI